MHVESLVSSNYKRKRADLLCIIFIKSPFLPLHLFLLPSRWPPVQWRPSCAWSADRNKKKHSGLTHWLTLSPGDNEFSSCCEQMVTRVRNAFVHLAFKHQTQTQDSYSWILHFNILFSGNISFPTMCPNDSLPIPHDHMCSSCDHLENDPPCLSHKLYKTLTSKWFLILL